MKIARFFPRPARRAFTLIELLAVIVIVGVVASLSATLAPGLIHSNRFTQNILTLSGVMEMARQHAITHNTYVWVALTEPNPDGVYIATLESKEGTDGLNWDATDKKISTFSNISLVRKVQLIPSLTLTDPGSLAIAGLPSANGSVYQLKNENVKVKIPVGGKDMSFTRALQFTPTGEARVATKSNFIDLGIAPLTPTGKNSNVAVLRLAGITGKLTVYRPN